MGERKTSLTQTHWGDAEKRGASLMGGGKCRAGFQEKGGRSMRESVWDFGITPPKEKTLGKKKWKKKVPFREERNYTNQGIRLREKGAILGGG